MTQQRRRPTDAGAARSFRIVGDCYILAIDDLGIRLEIDHVRRERNELWAELSVSCDLAGARTTEGVLAVGSINLSSPRARQDRGRYLAERSGAREIDWVGLIEELCTRVHRAERDGEPSVLLRDVPPPTPYDALTIDGLVLPRRHPSCVFGDGGTAKSYTALYLAGCLQRQGILCGFVDAELDAADHRERLERLFGEDMPAVAYLRALRPLVYDVDRIRRFRHERGLDYLFFDSVGVLVPGAPESAEHANGYIRALRQIGGGSMSLAHITKNAETNDQKPFGSVFFHNGFRSTWFINRAQTAPDGQQITIGLVHRKANLGRLQPAIGWQIDFDTARTTFKRVNLAEVQELAVKLPLWQRINHALRSGPLTIAAMAEVLGAKVDSITKAVTRSEGKYFARIVGTDGVDRWALLDRSVH
jgi:hypothetical protein